MCVKLHVNMPPKTMAMPYSSSTIIKVMPPAPLTTLSHPGENLKPKLSPALSSLPLSLQPCFPYLSCSVLSPFLSTQSMIHVCLRNIYHGRHVLDMRSVLWKNLHTVLDAPQYAAGMTYFMICVGLAYTWPNYHNMQ